MKYKTGDRVRFLNDVGGGVVNRVDDRGLIYVQTEDGFELPVTEKDLVFTRSVSYSREDDDRTAVVREPKPVVIEKSNKEKAAVKPLIPANIRSEEAAKFLIGFVPENDGPVFNSRISCFLINDSPFFAYFLAGMKEGGAMFYLESGYIEPDTKMQLKSLDQTSLSKISDINIQLILVSKGRYARREPVDKMLNLNLINFSKESYFRENDYFEEKAVLFDLTAEIDSKRDIHNIDVPEEIKELKSNADKILNKPKKKEIVQDSLEVDLHFDEDDIQNSRLNPGAILALQMSRFHAAIEEAIGKSIRRLVVIHGLGQGTLKMQIRKELQEKYPDFIYQDASFKEYGFGATLIHIVFDKKQ
jgi:hypothetical protein